MLSVVVRQKSFSDSELRLPASSWGEGAASSLLDGSVPGIHTVEREPAPSRCPNMSLASHVETCICVYTNRNVVYFIIDIYEMQCVYVYKHMYIFFKKQTSHCSLPAY